MGKEFARKEGGGKLLGRREMKVLGRREWKLLGRRERKLLGKRERKLLGTSYVSEKGWR